jgi:hypothetical protein
VEAGLLMNEPHTIAAERTADRMAEGGDGSERTATVTTEAAAPDYDQAWDAAQSSAHDMRDALITAGLRDAMPCLEPKVNIFGDGMLMLGMVGPNTGHRLAALIRAGLAAQPTRPVRAWTPDPAQGGPGRGGAA